MADQVDFAKELQGVKESVASRLAALESRLEQMGKDLALANSGGSVLTAKSVALFILDELMAVLGDSPGTVTHEKIMALRDRIAAMA